jgi:hypothetical protein
MITLRTINNKFLFNSKASIKYRKNSKKLIKINQVIWLINQLLIISMFVKIRHNIKIINKLIKIKKNNKK